MIASGFDADFLPVNKPSEMWKGVDVHIPLVWHIVQSRVPGALAGKNPKFENGFNPQQHRGGSNNRGGKNNRGRGRGGNWNKNRGR